MSPAHAHEPLSAQTKLFRRSVAIFTVTLVVFAVALVAALILRSDSINTNCAAINDVKQTLVDNYKTERNKSLKQLHTIERQSTGPIIKGISNAELERNQRQSYRRQIRGLSPTKC